jgi:hypothetical protein
LDAPLTPTTGFGRMTGKQEVTELLLVCRPSDH